MIHLFQQIFLALMLTLFGVVILRLLSGEIVNRGMAAAEIGGGIAPDRVQALVVAVAIPVGYLLMALSQKHEVLAKHSLPEVPEWLLITSASSQVLYLAGKIARS